MYLKTGNNFIKAGSNVLQNGENLILKLNSNRFPLTTDINNTGFIRLQFNKQITVTVNYGNGVIINYNTYYTNGVYEFYMWDKGTGVISTPPSGWTAYIYPDGQTLNRVVSINFLRSALINFQLGIFWLSNQDLIFGFARFPNLITFSCSQIGASQSGCIGNMDLANISSINSITAVSINSCFSPTSPYRGVIPSFLFSMPLGLLAVGDPSFTSSQSFSTNNLNSIYLLASTLKTLNIQNAQINDTNGGQGALPSSFASLINLTTLGLYSTLHTTIPSVVNSITSLTSLAVSYSSTLTNFGTISGLINLVTLSVNANLYMTPTLPSYFNLLTKLKTLDVTSNYHNTNIDTFVSSVYSLITGNASMSTGNTQFRQMTIRCGPNTTGDGTAIPSGTYQQPSGYVSGSSNGTPASSQEMIWVMVHQYAHSWIYRTV